MGLGMRSTFDALHYLLEEAFVEGVEGPELSDTFLAAIGSGASFAGGPLYAVLHEACYTPGCRVVVVGRTALRRSDRSSRSIPTRRSCSPAR